MLKRVLDRLWPGHPATLPELWDRAQPALVDITRLTTASVIAFLLTVVVFPGTAIDLTGTLTALLVMQASAHGSFRMGLVRVAAVLTGVGVALAVAAWAGLHWYTLAVVVFSALVLARVFRLGSQSLETAISGMLILSAVAQPVAAETRVLTTLIGTAVGMVFPLIIPPAIPTRSASGAVRDVSRRLGQLYAQASATLQSGPSPDAIEAPDGVDAMDELLTQTQGVRDLVTRAATLITEVSDLRKWNTRAVGTADVVPLLRSGLDTLDRCLAASRALFILLAEEAPTGEPAANTEEDLGEDVRLALASVLTDVGSCVDTFGALVEAEVVGREADTERLFAENVEALRETRAMLTDLMVVSPEQTELWMLRGSVLTAVEQILTYLDVEARVRQREDWQWSQVGLSLPADSVSPLVGLWQRRRRRVLERPTSSDAVLGDFLDEPTELLPRRDPDA